MSTKMLQSQLELAKENWQLDHQEAMACRDLEERIALVLHIRKRIAKVNDEGMVTLEFASEVADLLEELYHTMVTLVRAGDKCKVQGFNVENLEDIRKEARALGQTMSQVMAIGQTARHMKAGERRELSEIVNGMQSLSGA